MDFEPPWDRILSVRRDSGVLARVGYRKVAAAVADVRVVDRASRGFGPCPSWCANGADERKRSCILWARGKESPCSLLDAGGSLRRAGECHERCGRGMSDHEFRSGQRRRNTVAKGRSGDSGGWLRERLRPAIRVAKTRQPPLVVCRTVADWRTLKQSVKSEL